MLWLGVLAIAGLAAALLLPPLKLSRPSEPEPEIALTADNARGVCMDRELRHGLCGRAL
jgi:hypothetical protein